MRNAKLPNPEEFSEVLEKATHLQPKLLRADPEGKLQQEDEHRQCDGNPQTNLHDPDEPGKHDDGNDNGDDKNEGFWHGCNGREVSLAI